ncbi:MAG: outer membrane beta-barrel protein [Rubrivivax sp.]|nr:outer membrane beta-barrel protein [Rubrivivax sp.]
MQIHTLAATALLALAAAAPAAAQSSFAVYGGYRGGGSFEQDSNPSSSIDMKSSASGALAFNFGVDAARQGQVFVSYQSTDLEASPSTPKVPLSITYLHFGGTNYFEGAIGRGAYVAGGVGATWMSPSLSGLSSEVRPSLNLGLGFEWPITGALSLKAELRGYFTLINSNSSLFCSGGCVVAIKGDGLTQVEGLVGLNLAF